MDIGAEQMLEKIRSQMIAAGKESSNPVITGALVLIILELREMNCHLDQIASKDDDA